MCAFKILIKKKKSNKKIKFEKNLFKCKQQNQF